MSMLQADWREHVIDEALRAESLNGSGIDAAIREIRRFEQGFATCSAWIDRRRLHKFLPEQPGFQTLLRTSHLVKTDDDAYPYAGWYSVEWQGATIEIVFVPGKMVVCLSTDATLLYRYVADLQQKLERPTGRSLRYADGWEDAPDLDTEIEAVTWNDIVLPTATVSGIRDAVEGFFNHRHVFATLGFAWKRGILLIGPPGTGKTMVCKAVASALPSLPFLYVRDFDASYEDAVKQIFEHARKLAPCILAFEDIEGLVTASNRTVFLNELDGFKSNEGLLIVASSNHPAKIDEALLKRPSRFDRVFHIGLPEYGERHRFCLQLLQRLQESGQPSAGFDRDVLVSQVAKQTEGFTPAFLKEVFISAALRLAQEGKAQLDEQYAAQVLTQVGELKQHMQRLRDPEALAEIVLPSTQDIGFRPRG